MSRHSAESAALWTTTSLLSLAVVFVAPLLQDTTLEGRLLGALVAIPSMAFLHAAVRRGVARVAMRRLLGNWLYVTHPHEDRDWRGNVGYGLMRFDLDPLGRMRYSVALFKGAEELVEAARHGFTRRGAAGRAWALASTYDDERQCLWILYQAMYHGADTETRVGHLYVDLSSPERLNGHWASDIGKTRLSAGEMHACRANRFKEMHAEVMSKLNGRLAPALAAPAAVPPAPGAAEPEAPPPPPRRKRR